MSEKKTTAKPEKPKYNLWQNSAYMIQLAWKNRKSVLWYCLALTILEVASNLMGLFITPVILGAIEAASPLNVLIPIILLFALALMLSNAGLAYIRENTVFGRVELRFIFVSMIHEKFMKTSFPNTEDQDLQKKLDKARMSVNSNNKATEAVWKTLRELLTGIVGFSIYLALLVSLDPLLIAAVLVTTVTSFFISKHINEWGYRHRDEEAEYSRRMNYISNHAGDHTLAKDVRVFGMRGWLEDVYGSAFKLYQSFITRGERIYIWGDIVDLVLTFLRNGIAYWYLIDLVLKNGLSASQFLLYFAAIGGFTAWMGGILNSFSTLHMQSLDLSAVREFIEYPEMFTFEDGEPITPDNAKSYEIELRNVSFRYPSAEKDTLTNINLKIKAGEKLAVVGLNGAGKTTLVKLICGFIDPTKGEVLLNGENIKKYNRRDYYKHFSAVFQDFSLLATTIADNIAQTNEGADMEKIRLCAERAGLLNKIESLPAQFDTHVTNKIYEDGIELSGGETQRLMLARALYKDAPVIILDEPTAALDPIAESDMYNKYNELTGGRTSVYISHRLASTRFCDRVIFLGDNAISEEGTHDELMNGNGKYAELFEIQSRYYREGGFENEQEG